MKAVVVFESLWGNEHPQDARRPGPRPLEPVDALVALRKGVGVARGLGEAAKPERFLVTGRYGPLKDREVERARRWGAQLVG